jgi:hypothetical protein
VSDRVEVVATGRTGTVVRVGPDGDHLVCEVRYDRAPNSKELMLWSHSASELAPIP